MWVNKKYTTTGSEHEPVTVSTIQLLTFVTTITVLRQKQILHIDLYWVTISIMDNTVFIYEKQKRFPNLKIQFTSFEFFHALDNWKLNGDAQKVHPFCLIIMIYYLAHDWNLFKNSKQFWINLRWESRFYRD